MEEKQEFDMEVTPERCRAMKELLLRLYCDQYGLEVKSIKVYPKNAKPTVDETA